ncbi:MAG: hypothetical protein KJO40_18280 [Deltaproteobacteria bacterium]|nr:hypothetical protein [Deltaproteobacteria bacterium]
MAYVPAGFTDEEQTLLLESQAKLHKQLEEIIRRQDEEERRRAWALGLGALGALLAAARLGIVAIPFFKKRRLGRIGE